jgi:succinyl-CoA synthetase beta subunit
MSEEQVSKCLNILSSGRDVSVVFELIVGKNPKVSSAVAYSLTHSLYH